MLDRDLSELYDVELKVLNQAVKRNLERFPCDFMFQLNSNDLDKSVKKLTSSRGLVCLYGMISATSIVRKKGCDSKSSGPPLFLYSSS
jgi:hypothetical protein